MVHLMLDLLDHEGKQFDRDDNVIGWVELGPGYAIPRVGEIVEAWWDGAPDEIGGDNVMFEVVQIRNVFRPDDDMQEVVVTAKQVPYAWRRIKQT